MNRHRPDDTPHTDFHSFDYLSEDEPEEAPPPEEPTLADTVKEAFDIDLVAKALCREAGCDMPELADIWKEWRHSAGTIIIDAIRSEIDEMGPEPPRSDPIGDFLIDVLIDAHPALENTTAAPGDDPAPDDGVEPWMMGTADVAREYIYGTCELEEAFTWERSRQGHEYWAERRDLPFHELSPQDQQYIRLIASAGGE